MASTFEQLESMTPTPDEAKMTRESSRKLASLFQGLDLKNTDDARPVEAVEVEIRLDGECEIVVLPRSVLRLMEAVLSQTAQGHGVSIVPQQCELTTRQAAQHLGVSRPYLIGLLENADIPFRKVGTHRRILFGDVVIYKKAMRDQSRKALEELVAEGQKLGL